MNFKSLLLALLLVPSSIALYAQTEDSTKTTKQLDEIIVTATKTETNLTETPVAVSVLTAKKVEDSKIWDLSNLSGIVPNYINQGIGVGFQQIQGIRGIQVFSENPAISTYVDDVNSMDILANGFSLTDIERIEILRGPQGTLYGRNAMGGVINIITKKPTNTTTGNAELSFGNLGLQRYSASIKTPLLKNKLFLGVSGLYQYRNGYFKNDTTGTNAADGASIGKRVGDESNLYGNAYLKWVLSPKFNATINVKAQQDNSNASGFFVGVNDEKTAFSNPDKIFLSKIGTHTRTILNSALTLRYHAKPFTITSISTSQSIRLGFQDIISAGGNYSTYREKNIGELLPPQKVLSQELRISTNETSTSKLRYVAGFYGFTQVGYEPTTNLAYELSPGMYSVFRNKSNNDGIAIFGQLKYNVTKKLSATVGLRFEKENRKSTFNGIGDALLLGNTLTFIKPDTSVSSSFNAFSPKFILGYAITEKSSVYASYTRGFRAGGVNAQKLPYGVKQSYSPEYSNNYEAGYKLKGWGNKLTVNLAVFHIDWQNIQFFNVVAPFTYARENVGDAISQGVELEASVLPIKNFEVDLSFALNKTAYKGFVLRRVDFTTFQETTTEISGNKLSNAPSSTLYVGGQYSIPVGKNKFTIRGEFKNIGNYYTDIQNKLEQPSYSIINAKFGFESKFVGISVWAQNIGDTRYLAYGSPDTSFNRISSIAIGRTFGITLTSRF